MTSSSALYHSTDGYASLLLATAAPTETSGCLKAEAGGTGRTFYFRIDAVGSYSSGGPTGVPATPRTLRSNHAADSVRPAQPPAILSFVAKPESIASGQAPALSRETSVRGR